MTSESYMTSHFPIANTFPPNSKSTQTVVLNHNGKEISVSDGQLADTIAKISADLKHIDASSVAQKTISGLHNGCSMKEFNTWLVQTVAMFISEEPEYSKLAARFLSQSIQEELAELEIRDFSESIIYGHKVGIIADHVADFVEQHASALNAAIAPENQDLFEYFGLRTVYDRYLLKDPKSRKVFESPQHFFMRVACGLSQSLKEALEFYSLISSFQYMPSTPTLFNSEMKK